MAIYNLDRYTHHWSKVYDSKMSTENKKSGKKKKKKKKQQQLLKNISN